MKFFKIMFFLLIMIGSLISISSHTWFGMWLGLEINLLSIIPLMNSTNNLTSSEATLKYFITQALASTILLFSMIFISYKIPFIWNKNLIILMMNSSLLTKMGAAPFHFWFPEVMEGLTWLNCLIMLTWQKIAPMILIIYNLNYPKFFSIIILISMLVSGIMGLNQISLRKILTYSSINHIAWMLAAMFFNEMVWFWYFLIYTFMTINIILIFHIFKMFFIKQLTMKLNFNVMFKLFFSMNFLSLGGLPPFIGFFPKWITIQGLIMKNFYILAMMMILMTLMTLFYYIRLISSMILMSINELNYQINFNYNYPWVMISNYINILSLIFCTILFNFI
uniref:NADH-ubiquinone oxidoreductase chain 2 n=1 Tax=Lordithon arcuatus TaxID=2992776 RepID=A0A9E7V736_9COLE|nr:NADH dehydrogenase subunit 2 [Lordithon arcuatus]UZA61066.1 NADH dehydrogenase subunit 2 [Lordithon arcuatus]